MAIQPNGDIIIAGAMTPDLSSTGAMVIRMHPNGNLDPTFDGDGIATIIVPNNTLSGSAVTLQNDGKIIVACKGGEYDKPYDFCIIRLNTDGSPDQSFGTNGVSIKDIGGFEDMVTGMVLQKDGGILVAGYSFLAPNHVNPNAVLAKFDMKGNLDTSFGDEGKIFASIENGYAFGNAISLQKDGKIILGGRASDRYFNYGTFLFRYLPNGSLDSSFGYQGKVFTINSGQLSDVNSILVQPDGRIIAAGGLRQENLDASALLRRYNMDGTLDESYGLMGTVKLPLNNSTASVLQEDVKLLITGMVRKDPFNNDSVDYVLMRYNLYGQLDTTFGHTGIITTPISTLQDEAKAVNIFNDIIYVSGNSVIPWIPEDPSHNIRTAVSAAAYQAGSCLSAPSLSLQPKDVQLCLGGKASFYSAVDGATGTEVQWQVKENGNWMYIAGSNSPNYTIVPQISDNGKEYRAIFLNECGMAISKPAMLSVSEPVIFANQDFDAHTCQGGSNATFSVTLVEGVWSGKELRSNWQWSENGIDGWNDIAGTELLSTGLSKFHYTTIPDKFNFYYRLLVSYNGCTSYSPAAKVMVQPLVPSTTFLTICSSQLPYNWNGYDLTTSGIYTFQSKTLEGCDSVAIMYFTVNPSLVTTSNIRICEKELPYTWNGLVIEKSGEYSIHLNSMAGCDSIDHLLVEVIPETIITQSITVCQSELPYTWLGKQYFESGTYTQIVQGSNGCPQKEILKLEVINLNLSIITNNATCGSANGSASVQATGIPPFNYIWNTIPAQTNSTATGLKAGNYNVTVTNGLGCVSFANVTIKAEDTEVPQIIPPGTITFCSSQASYSIPLPYYHDNCGVGSITFAIKGSTIRSGTGDNASGIFNEGVSTITWTITDAGGNSTSATTKVIIIPGIHGFIQDAFALSMGVKSNTVYKGYTPASFIDIKAEVSDAGNSSYLWNTGATTAIIRVNPDVMTTYSVTISNNKGCSFTLNKTIEVMDVRCGNKQDKVIICKNGNESCVSASAVPALLKNGFLGSCTLNTSRNGNAQSFTKDENLDINALPNPSHSSFLLQVHGNKTGAIFVNIYTSNGQLIEQKKAYYNQALIFGESYGSGIYFAEIVQDYKRQTIKLIKIK
jgi:uncharacterized delta-60 repeat protein